jgi:signal transduction histidine kinase
MITRDIKILILGEVPEVGDIFDRPIFQVDLPTSPTHISNPDKFEQGLDEEEPYALVLIDITPHGIEVLELVREKLPACPVVMIGDPDEGDKLLEAKRKGLEAYLLRALDNELFTDLLAEEIYTQITRFVEPPTMKSPSADQMYRYAQFHNVLQPFFVVARQRYLLYVNKAGRDLLETLHGREPQVGIPLGQWGLEASDEELSGYLDRAFNGHEVVHERDFDHLGEAGLREIHYQPVTSPKGQVVSVSIAVSQPARPELQRARTMQQLSALAAAVSHENNNLLNVLMSNTDLLSDRLTMLGDREANRHMQTIENAIERATQFTHQLQAFSRTGVSQPEWVSVNEVVESLVEPLSVDLPSNVDLVIDLERDLPTVWDDRGHWRAVVTNMVENGAKEMEDEGKLQVSTRSLHVTPSQESLPVGPGDYIVVEFGFDGRALADWVNERGFDPFFTGHRVDHHAGLELATVKSIVEQGGGHIVAHLSDQDSDKNADQKTTVCIYYPYTAQPADKLDGDTE